MLTPPVAPRPSIASLPPAGPPPLSHLVAASNKLSEDEYENDWYSPMATLVGLRERGLTPEDSMAAILYRIDAGSIDLAALDFKMRAEGASPHDEQFWKLPPNVWTRIAIEGSFWNSGEATFRRRYKPDGPDFTFMCSGLRFDPQGVRRLFSSVDAKALPKIDPRPQAAALVPSPRASGRAPVGAADLNLVHAWAETFRVANPNATFGVFILNARARFNPKSVAELPMKRIIAELKMTKKVGKPSGR